MEMAVGIRPMIVENANRMMPMETIYLPTGPMKASKAAIVRLTPCSGVPVPSAVPSTPEEAMTRPVEIVRIPNQTVTNISSSLFSQIRLFAICRTS